MVVNVLEYGKRIKHLMIFFCDIYIKSLTLAWLKNATLSTWVVKWIYVIIVQCVPVYYINAGDFSDEFDFTDTANGKPSTSAFPPVKDGFAITMAPQ